MKNANDLYSKFNHRLEKSFLFVYEQTNYANVTTWKNTRKCGMKNKNHNIAILRYCDKEILIILRHRFQWGIVNFETKVSMTNLGKLLKNLTYLGLYFV